MHENVSMYKPGEKIFLVEWNNPKDIRIKLNTVTLHVLALWFPKFSLPWPTSSQCSWWCEEKPQSLTRPLTHSIGLHWPQNSTWNLLENTSGFWKKTMNYFRKPEAISVNHSEAHRGQKSWSPAWCNMEEASGVSQKGFATGSITGPAAQFFQNGSDLEPSGPRGRQEDPGCNYHI